MIKTLLTITAVAAFAIGSAFAGKCGSSCGDKGGKKGGEGSKETHSVQIAL